MKWYGNAPGASMHMHEDPELIGKLELLILGALRHVAPIPFTKYPMVDEVAGYLYQLGPVTVAIETGTYLGTGSTRFIAEAFERTRPPKVFHTIEVSHTAWIQAKENLARFPFVNPLWGSAVEIESAAEWLEQDEVLRTPYAYPDVWTDHLDPENSAQHYATEMRGSSAVSDWPECGGQWAGEGLLKKLLEQHADDQPLVILDSAGGIGWLEFQIMLETMGDRRYYVLLDDVQHVKHFRSRDYILGSPDFGVILESGKALLAVHKAVL